MASEIESFVRQTHGFTVQLACEKTLCMLQLTKHEQNPKLRHVPRKRGSSIARPAQQLAGCMLHPASGSHLTWV